MLFSYDTYNETGEIIRYNNSKEMEPQFDYEMSWLNVVMLKLALKASSVLTLHFLKRV